LEVPGETQHMRYSEHDLPTSGHKSYSVQTTVVIHLAMGHFIFLQNQSLKP